MIEIMLMVVIVLLALMWRELVRIRRRDTRVTINVELLRSQLANLRAGQSLQTVYRYPMYVAKLPDGRYALWCAGAHQVGDLDTVLRLMIYYNPDPLRWVVYDEIPPQLAAEMEIGSWAD